MVAVKRWLNLRPQYVDGNGAPANGYRLFFYTAGSSTKLTVYNSSAGTVPSANPLTLNSLGEPPNEVWLIAGQFYKVGMAAPGVDDPPGAFVWTEDNIVGINDITTNAADLGEWRPGPVPIFISATQFTVTGDYRSTFEVNRKVKSIVTGGNSYGRITSATFSAGVTTVTVDTTGSIVLDSGLSAVFFALLSATNPSSPSFLDSQPLVRNATDPTKGVLIDASQVPTGVIKSLIVGPAGVIESVQGSAIASAATINLDNATGDYVHITGTVAITAITLAQGRSRTVVFDGVLTLTNGASLITGTGLNVITAPGDSITFRGEAAGVVRVLRLGSMLTGNDLLLQIVVASNQATVPIINLPAGFDVIEIDMVNIIPVSAAALDLRMSINNGSSYDAGAASYQFAVKGASAAAAELVAGNAAASIIRLTHSTSINTVASAGGLNGILKLFNLGAINVDKLAKWEIAYFDNTPNFITLAGAGVGIGTANALRSTVNAIQFTASTGNIASGTFYVRGRKNA